MKTILERIHEIRDDFYKEIEKGNYTLLKVEDKNDGWLHFTINVEGLEMKFCMFKNDKHIFSFKTYHYSLFKSEDGFKCPENLYQHLLEMRKETREKRMKELMDEYTKLAKHNDEP